MDDQERDDLWGWAHNPNNRKSHPAVCSGLTRLITEKAELREELREAREEVARRRELEADNTALRAENVRLCKGLESAHGDNARLRASQRDVVRRAADLVKFAVYGQWSKGEKTAWSDLSDAIDRGFDKLAQGEGSTAGTEE